MRRAFQTILAIASVVLLVSGQAAAAAGPLTDAQKKVLQEQIHYFNTEESALACSGLVTGAVTGNDNKEKVFNYLVGKGLSAAQAAGIMGNINQESSFNPAAAQSSGAWDDMSNASGRGVGLVQWDGGRRPNMINYALDHGVTRDELKTASDKGLLVELDYIWEELNGSYKDSTLVRLQAATTAEDAARIFHKYYEVSADNESQIQERLNDAKTYFAAYGGSAPAAGAITGGACGARAAGDFIEYKQCNYGSNTVAWAGIAYGNSTICNSGCGPSAMAMIITNLTGKTVTPDMTATYGATNGTTIGGGANGSAWNIADVIGSHWGLKATGPLGSDVTAINAVLQQGGMVLATGTGPVPFTDGGHFIVIRALTADGKWLTGNSANIDSSQPYDPASVLAAGNSKAPGFQAWGLTAN